jgi:hypothetical protein
MTAADSSLYGSVSWVGISKKESVIDFCAADASVEELSSRRKIFRQFLHDAFFPRSEVSRVYLVKQYGQTALNKGGGREKRDVSDKHAAADIIHDFLPLCLKNPKYTICRTTIAQEKLVALLSYLPQSRKHARAGLNSRLFLFFFQKSKKKIPETA